MWLVSQLTDAIPSRNTDVRRGARNANASTTWLSTSEGVDPRATTERATDGALASAVGTWAAARGTVVAHTASCARCARRSSALLTLRITCGCTLPAKTSMGYTTTHKFSVVECSTSIIIAETSAMGRV